MSKTRRVIVIGQYTCGCCYGPVERSKRLEYCAKHGGDIQKEYREKTTAKGKRIL